MLTVCACGGTEPKGPSQQDQRRFRETMDRIAALPDEAPGDSFSGADHDEVLYGKP